MKIKRTFDSKLVNSIVRNSDVFPFVKDDSMSTPEEFDCTPILDNSNNIALSVINDRGIVVGVFIFVALTVTTFEVHTNLLSECRGVDALMAGSNAMDFMFTATSCTRLVTRVPEPNKPALSYAKKFGFEIDYVRENSFSLNGKLFSQTYLSFDIYAWMRLSSEKFKRIGGVFHKNLENLKNETGIGNEIHDDDEAHDAAVGVAIAMMLAGQTKKSEYHFNEWGRLAGYAPAKHLGIDEDGRHIIDINEAIITIDNSLSVGVA